MAGGCVSPACYFTAIRCLTNQLDASVIHPSCLFSGYRKALFCFLPINSQVIPAQDI
nr:MAG TPA: hypothetical protein [Inoviridae sp.]